MIYLLDLGIISIVFLIYYLAVLIFNKRLITNPSEIVSKFFMVLLFYLGVILVYFAITGQPINPAEFKSIDVYIFITGFLAVLLSLPNLLKDFGLFKKVIFTRRRSERR